MTLPLAVIVLVAVAISMVGTLVARYAAVRFAWLDQPSRRKLHANPIPLLGGIAIYNAFLVAALLADSRRVLAEGTTVLIGATLLLIVGVIDDQRGLSPRVKLIAQAIAALLLVVGGISVSFLPFEWLNILATVLWVVAICNAMNLLDNMDGLSAGVAAIASGFFTVLAVWHGQIWVSLVGAVLLGATLGFLRFNWNPATIFMGDAGSLLLGFLLAVLAIKLRFEDVDPRRTWAIPILILAVPIFDTTVVTLSRLRRGVPITSGGRDHVSHRLVSVGLSIRQAVGTIYLAAFVCGLAAVLAILLPSLIAVYAIFVAIAVAGLVALYLLERVDLSDTGQVARSPEERRSVALRLSQWRPAHHVLRPSGAHRVVSHGNRPWRKLLRNRRTRAEAPQSTWVRWQEQAETARRR
jgi:UDP-GlcNAc:undecaprenyl-phosphate GlcNAc-1-phosphate transferase